MVRPVAPNSQPSTDFQALRHGERLGRRKAKHGVSEDKLCGRNEIIAFFIETHLPGSMANIKNKDGGEMTPRKQISSHLQTLKNMLKHNTLCKSLELPKLRISPRALLGMSLVTEPGKGQRSCPPPVDLTSGYPRSRKFSMPPRNPYNFASHRYNISPLLPPPEVLGSNGIHRVNLEFCVSRRRPSSERIHTYTRIQCETGAAPKCLDEIQNWRTLFPQLVPYIDERQFDGELVHYDTSLDLEIEYPSNSELAMITDVVIKEGKKYRDWTSVTSLYERGNLVEERLGIKVDPSYRALNYEDQKQSNETVIALKYNTKWFAYNIFAEVHKRVLQAREDFQATQDAIEWGRQFIREWSMVQEVWARPSGVGTELQRTAIFLWTFQCARSGEAATTVWRKLTLPSPKMPTLFELPPPISLLSHLPVAEQNHIANALTSQHGLSYDEVMAYNDRPQELLLMQPSNVSSCSDTPGADYKSSFPSSTSSSFPSSISSLDPALQDASHDTHDLAYLAKVSSFHAQVNAMSAGQDNLSCMNYGAPRTASFESEDVDYHSQETPLSYQSKDQMQYIAEAQDISQPDANLIKQQQQITPYYPSIESEAIQHNFEVQQQHQHGVVCAETDIISPVYDHAVTAQLAEMLQRHDIFDLQQQQQPIECHDSTSTGEGDYARYDGNQENKDGRRFSQTSRSIAPEDEITLHSHDPYAIHALSAPYHYHATSQPYATTPHDTEHYEDHDAPMYSHQQQSTHYPAEPQYYDQPLGDNAAMTNHQIKPPTTSVSVSTTNNDNISGVGSSAGSSFEMVPNTSMNIEQRHVGEAIADGGFVMINNKNGDSEEFTNAIAHWDPEQWNAAMEYAAMMSGHGHEHKHGDEGQGIVEEIQERVVEEAGDDHH